MIVLERVHREEEWKRADDLPDIRIERILVIAKTNATKMIQGRGADEQAEDDKTGSNGRLCNEPSQWSEGRWLHEIALLTTTRMDERERERERERESGQWLVIGSDNIGMDESGCRVKKRTKRTSEVSWMRENSNFE
jgi:hypothetical protein